MNGIVIIDKPPGKTSFDVIREIRRVLKIKKVGHTGTLDPLATGVLPVCIQEATKLVQFFSANDKKYQVTMLLGIETDTLDMEGSVTRQRKVDAREEDIVEALQSFVGETQQIPPQYSAIKIKGKPSYAWTREGFAVFHRPRAISVYDITALDVSLPYVTFAVSCSKGTYIRSLCRDIGNKLKCGACVAALRRIRSGSFREETAIRIDQYKEEQKQAVLQSHIMPMADALPELSTVVVSLDTARKIRQGYQPTCKELKKKINEPLCKGEYIKVLTDNQSMVAIAKMLYSFQSILQMGEDEQAVKLMRVFNNGF